MINFMYTVSVPGKGLVKMNVFGGGTSMNSKVWGLYMVHFYMVSKACLFSVQQN